jgi:hypothetical protein
MGDACEMLVAAELTLGGVPALKVPDSWPDYDIIAQPAVGKQVAYAQVGAGYVGYYGYDVFDRLAFVLLHSADGSDRAVYLVPRFVNGGGAFFRGDQVDEMFSDFRDVLGWIRRARVAPGNDC